MNKVILITGGSSGIGKCTAAELSRRGHSVYELSRRGGDAKGVNHLIADVTDEAAVRRAVDEVIKKEGRIDLLINCAGFGISGAVEFTEIADAKRLLDVNLFGTINTCRAVIPYMRAAQRGRIINISSVAAPVSIPYQAYYSVSKASVNSITLSLANELSQFGIEVCAIMPGDIHTGFTDSREKLHAGDDIYNGRISAAVATMEKDERSAATPEKAAAYIAHIAEKRKVKPLYAIGGKYKFFVLLVKLLPVGLANKIVGMMYS